MRQGKFPGGESAKVTDAPAKPIRDITGKDKETLVSIVKEMTESMSGAQSTRHWAEDALWFDIPPFASRGIQPALKFFDKVFGSFQSCKVDILLRKHALRDAGYGTFQFREAPYRPGEKAVENDDLPFAFEDRKRSLNSHGSLELKGSRPQICRNDDFLCS
jgi:hypothetical protein